MLKLINITAENNIISANYDPENTGVSGFVSLDYKTGDILESRASEFDEEFPTYLQHAITALRKLTAETESEIPEEKLIAWY